MMLKKRTALNKLLHDSDLHLEGSPSYHGVINPRSYH